MLAYYPLEHLYYLLTHAVIPDKLPLPSPTAFVPFIRTKPSESSIPLDAGKLGIWSTRFWAAYVILQLAHLREDTKLLQMQARTLAKTKVGACAAPSLPSVTEGPDQTGATAAEKEDLRKRRSALWNELIVNLAYLPQTIHWCVAYGISFYDVHGGLAWVVRYPRPTSFACFSRLHWHLPGLPTAHAPFARMSAGPTWRGRRALCSRSSLFPLRRGCTHRRSKNRRYPPSGTPDAPLRRSAVWNHYARGCGPRDYRLAVG